MSAVSNLAVPLALLVVSANPPSTPSLKPGECTEVRFTGSASYDPATDAFVGGGPMQINGASLPIQWSTILLGQRGGEYTSSHVITSAAAGWENERISTFDKITLTPTTSPAAFDFVLDMAVKTGTGQIDSGEVLVNGHVDFAAGTVQVASARGKFCNSR